MENTKLLFNGFKDGFKDFGYVVSTLVNTILIFLIFIFGIGLVAFFSMFFQKKFLDMKPISSNGSYWLEKTNRNKNKEDSLKPF